MKRVSAAHLIVEYLIEEGVEYVFGIFGHGNVQLGSALYERRDKIRYITVRNEQAGVHAAAAIARMIGKPQVVTTSVGPGATNLVTGAAMARINRWPVLLLPGEIFAENVGPVLQELESTVDLTANDSLRPVSKYWTRLTRASQLRRTLREAFEAMMEPGNEGPATICIPMDVQAESFDYDIERVLAPRDRRYPRFSADHDAIACATRAICDAKRPLIIAGGGVLRSNATEELVAFAEYIAAPVVPTQAGKGSIVWTHPLTAFGMGPTGTAMGNHLAARADLVIGIGTRYSDFVTASETAFSPSAQFININICHFDVGKENAIKLWGDAKATLKSLLDHQSHQKIPARGSRKDPQNALTYRADLPYFREISDQRTAWLHERAHWCERHGSPLPQEAAVALINEILDERSTIVNAAGTLPATLQKVWLDKAQHGLGYLCEYGYSTMGFEVAAGMGIKLAMPDRRVVVLVGDMSFLMMPSELVTAVEHKLAVTVIVFDNGGGQSIRGLQKRSGLGEYGMEYGYADGRAIDIDYAKIAEGMGCYTIKANTLDELKRALETSTTVTDRPTVIHLVTEKNDFMPGYESWWDVPQPQHALDGRERAEWRNYWKEKTKQIIR